MANALAIGTLAIEIISAATANSRTGLLAEVLGTALTEGLRRLELRLGARRSKLSWN
jgi:hypothetical protein